MSLFFYVFQSILIVINCQSDNITINTGLGSITGVIESNFVVFRGISYSEYPPIGNYRFRESTVRNSLYTDIYDATVFRFVCMQNEGPQPEEQPMSEDCLHLNIWTPNIDINNGTIVGDSLPVILWIHGGSFTSRSGSFSLFNGKAFMRNQNIIYISINYRLGTLGFLSLETILSENGRTSGAMNGINDMIVALQWVQNNIADYGGDPNQVTIFGESAGGAAVCTLIVSEQAVNLFSKAIIQSGTYESSLHGISYENGLTISQNALQHANLTDDLDILRSLNATEFLKFVITPATDGYILTDTLYNIFTNDPQTLQLNTDRLIIGFTNMDTLRTFPYFLKTAIDRGPVNSNELRAYLSTYIDNNTQVQLLRNLYYPIEDFPSYIYNNSLISNYSMTWFSIDADICFICPSINFAQLLLENINIGNNVYLYNFIGPSFPYYIPHAGELPFIFNNSNFAQSFWGTSWSYNLSYFITEVWQNYVIYGVPNSTVLPIEWLPFSVNGTAMNFKNNNGEIKQYYDVNYRNGVCEFWQNEIGTDIMSRLCSQTISVNFDDDDKLETWMIIVIGITTFFVFVIIILLLWKLRVYCNKKRVAFYAALEENSKNRPMYKYGGNASR
eukprot:57659_1